MGGGEPLQALPQRGGRGQVDLARGDGGLGEVEVRVGQPGDRDLVGFQTDPLRERIGARLEIDLGAGERDAPVADPDGLDPAEPLVPDSVAIRPVMRVSRGMSGSG